jgi:hypothetical protein
MTSSSALTLAISAAGRAFRITVALLLARVAHAVFADCGDGGLYFFFCFLEKMDSFGLDESIILKYPICYLLKTILISLKYLSAYSRGPNFFL